MRWFARALVVVNVVTLGWLIVSARMDLPLWEDAFDSAKAAALDLGEPEATTTIQREIVYRRIEAAETFSRMTIHEYRRAEVPLLALGVVNIIGLSILAMGQRRGQQVATE